MDQRILAADDDAAMREIYQYVLTDAGYEATVVGDGREALAALQGKTFHLVLLDIKMPGVSGWGVLEVIRSTPEWQDIPVVMVSALPEPSGENADASRRYDCYVTKKKTGNDLLVFVEQVLDDALSTPTSCSTDSG